MTKLTKRQKKIQEMLEGFEQPATMADAIKKIQEISKETSKFNETVECHMRLGIDVKHADQQIRSTTVLPAGLGKDIRVCVIAKGAKATEAKAAGADEAGAEEVIDKIDKGWFEFDTLIATPDCMGMLGKLGRVLGPKGLMPNPKTGTVTLDVATAVKDAKAGKVEFRADKQGMIHCPVGKIQFKTEDLLKNFATLAEAVIKAKPSSSKGTYLKSVYLATTMGPGIKLDSKNLASEIKEYVS
ncbi:MAG TPA: 50S ribosomal protein L1 [Candidatus Gastranaerophilaceae bacterium]|nr:50S ribosomal protein L1 [Candidatus Gastranaerophilaceae bacterium]HPT41801.1 50S ribosomal protein L1 [Candidatus Gastranaerophilaceae bacterium]